MANVLEKRSSYALGLSRTGRLLGVVHLQERDKPQPLGLCETPLRGRLLVALFVGLVYYVLGPIQELHATTYFGWSIYKETITNFNQKRQIYRFYPRK